MAYLLLATLVLLTLSIDRFGSASSVSGRAVRDRDSVILGSPFAIAVWRLVSPETVAGDMWKSIPTSKRAAHRGLARRYDIASGPTNRVEACFDSLISSASGMVTRKVRWSMRTAVHVLIAALLLVALAGAGGVIYVRSTGLRGQPEPGPIETRLARTIRGLAIPSEIKARTNPLAPSPDALRPGLEHFAKYCAMCHGNDGSGRETPIGRGLFPKPPDMRVDSTQTLTDGELFYIIENGVRFTGMPAFGTGKEDPAGDKLAWQLVTFIRHLPRITTDEVESMKALNPL